MPTTRDRILASARHLAQTRGYNGFSYADISQELAIAKPSIHHHFASKAQLADALVADYRERFDRSRDPLDDPDLSAEEQLLQYAGLYAEVFRQGGRLCLCGVLAADAASLPSNTRRAVAAFFADQLAWVTSAFRSAGLDAVRAQRAGRAYLAALEGALLLARAAAHGPATTTGDGRPGRRQHEADSPGSSPGPSPDTDTSGVLGVAATLLNALL